MREREKKNRDRVEYREKTSTEINTKTEIYSRDS
jgi:hypothetical protein